MGPIWAAFLLVTSVLAVDVLPLASLLTVVGGIAVADWRCGIRPLDRVRRGDVDANLETRR